MLLKRWDQQMNEEDSSHATKELALLFASRITSDLARGELERLVSDGDLAGLCNFAVDYEELSTADVISARQVLALFTKNGDLDLGLNREALTLDKLYAAEERCKETNEMFKQWGRGRFQFRPRVEAAFHAAAQFIADTLGDIPELRDLKFRFGPGATTNVTKSTASRDKKLREKLTCSEDLLPIVHHVLREMPAWVDVHRPKDDSPLLARVEFQLNRNVQVSTSPAKLGFAPKNASIFRTTCIQPSISMMYQLALEEVLAGRLLSIGVDIRDQTKNQRLAREGSLTGEIATLDLISASDCKSKGLVQHLLPLGWHELLSYGRTSYIKLPSGWMIYSEQFSSMGNGFTFPLMTLILYALVRAVTPKRLMHQVNVFGDDITCPTSVVDRVKELLDAAGFWVNHKKSFTSGRFRESCGADYMLGVNVRPVYIKRNLSGMALFTLHNFFRRCSDDEAADLCLTYMDPSIYRWGPDGYGDGHLIPATQSWGGMYESTQGDRDKWGTRRPQHIQRGFEGTTFRTYTTKARKSFIPVPGDYVYALYSVYVDGQSGSPDYPAVMPGHRVCDSLDIGPGYKWRRDSGRKLSCKDVPRVVEKQFHDQLIIADEATGSECELVGVSVPGWEGYKEVRIYTLDRW